MKHHSLFCLSLFFYLATLSFAQETHRLPLGAQETRLDLAVIQPGQIYSSEKGKMISEEELIARLASARVVLLGEDHDNLEQHQKQARFIELLQKKTKVVIGMEFFEMQQQAILEGWVNQEIGEKELLEKSGWFKKVGFHYRHYKPIMDVARKYAIPTYGVNIPRSEVRQVSRGGWDALSQEQKTKFSPLEKDPEHRYLIQRMLGKFAVMAGKEFSTVYAAQCLWDAAMATHILEILSQHEEGTTMVVIAGNGHVSYDLGIPRCLKQRGENNQVSLVFQSVQARKSPHGQNFSKQKNPHGSKPKNPHSKKAETSSEKTKEVKKDPHFKMGMSQGQKSEIFSRNLGKYVVGTYDSSNYPLPRLGVMIEERDQEVKILSAVAHSFAHSMKWQAGDAILYLNGEKISSLLDLQVALLSVNWQDKVGWIILRGKEEIKGEGQIKRFQ